MMSQSTMKYGLTSMIFVSSFFTISIPVFAVSWSYMGQASTGEDVYLDTDSITPARSFRYDIGGELINAQAYCDRNEWYVEGYGFYSPQSRATQRMLDTVCS